MISTFIRWLWRGSVCWQVDCHEALPCPWPRSRQPDREVAFRTLTIVVREVEEKGGRIMGLKINPIGLRLGINRMDSRWHANTGE